MLRGRTCMYMLNIKLMLHRLLTPQNNGFPPHLTQAQLVGSGERIEDGTSPVHFFDSPRMRSHLVVRDLCWFEMPCLKEVAPLPNGHVWACHCTWWMIVWTPPTASLQKTDISTIFGGWRLVMLWLMLLSNFISRSSNHWWLTHWECGGWTNSHLHPSSAYWSWNPAWSGTDQKSCGHSGVAFPCPWKKTCYGDWVAFLGLSEICLLFTAPLKP